MNETEKLQMLHQRAVKGEYLDEEEQTALQNWYDHLDREEGSLLNISPPIKNIEELRRNLTEVTDQTETVSREVKTLFSQNEILRKENQVLKQSLEARLVEKVA